MQAKSVSFTVTFDQHGDFLGIESIDRKMIPSHNVIREVPNLPTLYTSPMARILLGVWRRIGLGSEGYAYCFHIPWTCDCFMWRRRDWTGNLTFTLSFDQRGEFINIRFADGDPLDTPDHNMMKDMHIGNPVASRSLGELMRLELNDGSFAFFYHRVPWAANSV